MSARDLAPHRTSVSDAETHRASDAGAEGGHEERLSV